MAGRGARDGALSAPATARSMRTGGFRSVAAPHRAIQTNPMALSRPALFFLLLVVSPLAAQPLRLGAIERRHPDAIVLVADAQTGRMLGGIRVSEARSARYYPASLFKLAIAMTLLESGADPSARRGCSAADTAVDRRLRCWLPAGHGTLGLVEAIAQSCNAFFRDAANGLSSAAIATRARSLGMLPREHSGVIPAGAILGEAAMVTPSQLMRAALALASRGRLAQPPLPLASPRYRPIYDGLRECVRTGTARSAWSARTSIGGKTGTTVIDDRPGARAGWFIGFAPFDRPQYAIVVLDRRGIGSDAAALAREVLETIL